MDPIGDSKRTGAVSGAVETSHPPETVGTFDARKVKADKTQPERMSSMSEPEELEDGLEYLQLSRRKVTVEGVEQGPIALSPIARVESKYWITNPASMLVFRAAKIDPETVIAEHGLHTKSMGSSGAEFHLIGNNTEDYDGGISTTANEKVAKEFYNDQVDEMEEGETPYLYRINLPAKQGVDMVETIFNKYKNFGMDFAPLPGTEENKRSNNLELRERLDVAEDEEEFLVLGNITLEQLEVWDYDAVAYRPIREYVNEKQKNR